MELARASGVARSQVGDVIAARTRPRLGTLTALVDGLLALAPDAGGGRDELLAELRTVGVAPPSRYEGADEAAEQRRRERREPIDVVRADRRIRQHQDRLGEIRRQRAEAEVWRRIDAAVAGADHWDRQLSQAQRELIAELTRDAGKPQLGGWAS
jgi:hypothetical protein